jgi:hypothetical protein
VSWLVAVDAGELGQNRRGVEVALAVEHGDYGRDWWQAWSRPFLRAQIWARSRTGSLRESINRMSMSTRRAMHITDIRVSGMFLDKVISDQALETLDTTATRAQYPKVVQSRCNACFALSWSRQALTLDHGAPIG